LRSLHFLSCIQRITHQRIHYDLSAGPCRCAKECLLDPPKQNSLSGDGRRRPWRAGRYGRRRSEYRRERDRETDGGARGAGFAVCSTEAVLSSAHNRRNSRHDRKRGQRDRGAVNKTDCGQRWPDSNSTSWPYISDRTNKSNRPWRIRTKRRRRAPA
jgi:hypothetical protein